MRHIYWWRRSYLASRSFVSSNSRLVIFLCSGRFLSGVGGVSSGTWISASKCRRAWRSSLRHSSVSDGGSCQSAAAAEGCCCCGRGLLLVVRAVQCRGDGKNDMKERESLCRPVSGDCVPNPYPTVWGWHCFILSLVTTTEKGGKMCSQCLRLTMSSSSQ